MQDRRAGFPGRSWDQAEKGRLALGLGVGGEEDLQERECPPGGAKRPSAEFAGR